MNIVKSNDDDELNKNLLVLLEHSSSCDLDNACCFLKREECKQMKILLEHFARCELFPCVICKDMTDLTKLHAKNCQSSRCRVEKCNIIRHSMMCGSLQNSPEQIAKQPRILKIVSDSHSTNPVQNNATKMDLSIDTSFLKDSPKKTVYHCSKCRQPKNSYHKCTMVVSPEKKVIKETKKRKFTRKTNEDSKIDDIVMLPNRCENSFNMILECEKDQHSIYNSKHNKTKIAIELRKIRMIEKREDFIKKKMNAVAKESPKTRKPSKSISYLSLTSHESSSSESQDMEDQNKNNSSYRQVRMITNEDNSYLDDPICLTPRSFLDDQSLFDSFSFDFSDLDDINGINFTEDIFST